MEYREGFTVCADCGAALLPGLPPQAPPRDVEAAASLAQVFVGDDPLQAELVASTLRGEGIEALVRTRFAGGLTLTPSETHWVPGQQRIVLVPSVAEERAREVIDSLGEPAPEAVEMAPEPIEPGGRAWRWAPAKVAAFLILSPLLVSLAVGLVAVIAGAFSFSPHAGAPPRAPVPRAMPRDEKAIAAFREREAACRSGSLGACVNLGADYEEGNGVERDPIEAVRLFRKACEGGFLPGCSLLGWAYEHGEGVPIDEKEAVRLYRRGCDGKDAESCRMLAGCRRRGAGVEKSASDAVRLYRKACDLGSVVGCYNLGVSLDLGEGVTQSLPDAIPLYERACEGGHAPGCYALGYSFKSGKGVPADPKRAALLYDRACGGGEAPACYALAYMYDRGDGIERNSAEAARLFGKACQGGYQPACGVAAGAAK